ncbi:putative inorganic phosphate cotransporter isoform X2 [Plodia interpunctella]|nr:putative inorganic phosphate cotransporter isoform X2 [Plodia interpunctella]
MLLGQKTWVPKTKDNALTKTLRKYCIIPQRYILSIVTFFGICNAFMMRACLNLAITQMVKVNITNQEFYDESACPNDKDDVITNVTSRVNVNPYAIGEWDQATQGFILSGFYYGYILTQIPAGYLAEKLGGKWTLGLGLLSTAIFTFLTPIVTRTGGATWLFVLRLLQGMGEGPTMPAVMILLARWVPPLERSIQGVIVFGGAPMGNILGYFLSGILLSEGRDWSYVFYVFGGFGILWFFFWSISCYSTPNTHPFISEKELRYLNDNVASASKVGANDPVPWKGLIRSVPVWAMIGASIGHDWGYYTIMSDLPKYSHDVLKFNIAAAGTMNALPYLATWLCSFLFGFICNFCIKKGWHSIRTGRIIYTTIGGVGPAVCIVMASYSGCDRNLAMVFFVLGMGLMGAFYCGMKVNPLDLAPNYAGSLTSLVNTSSTSAGILTPYVVGLMTPNSTLQEWRGAFWLCFAVIVSSNVVYAIWADGKQQWWDDVRQHGYPPGWKHGPIIKEADPEEFEAVQNLNDFEKK